MTDQTEASTPEVPTPTKRRLRDRLTKRVDPNTQPVKPNSTILEKAKTSAAVVGVVAVGGALAVYVAKKRGANGVEVHLPDVEVTSES